MADQGAFVLPAGVAFHLEGDALCIETGGDVFIEGAPGTRFHRVISTDGDIVFRPDEAVSLHTIRAPRGRVTVSGRIAVESIHARDLSFRKGTLRASVIKATGTVNLSGERFEGNVVVGKQIQIAPSLVGRATAIYSEEPMGPHRLKGGFSLEEFVVMVPDGATLLEAHDIVVPEGSAATAVAPPPEPEPPEPEPPEPSPAPSEPDPPEHRIHEAVAEIRTQYPGATVPGSVTLLVTLADQRDFRGLSEQMQSLWSDLLRHHQKAGEPISNSTAKSFQRIQVALQELEG